MKATLICFLILARLSAVAIGYNGNSHHHAGPPVVKNGIYKFAGKLNNRIPVFIWFTVKDSVLKGEITYLKTVKRIPITIIGTLKGSDYHFWEFTKSGEMTGYCEGQFKGNALAGAWNAPGSEKELSYNLAPCDTALNNIDTLLKPKVITGEYAYIWGKSGGSGSISIKVTKPGMALVSGGSVTSAPANNVASVDEFTAPIINNTITYQLPGTGCKFRIRLYRDFIMVDLLSDIFACRWGLNASIDGIFYKTLPVKK